MLFRQCFQQSPLLDRRHRFRQPFTELLQRILLGEKFLESLKLLTALFIGGRQRPCGHFWLEFTPEFLIDRLKGFRRK